MIWAQQTGDRHLFFDHMLLTGGFARDVRLTIRGGVLAAIEAGVAAQSGDERHGCGLPGMPNLHSHAFQRGMAGLAERRGPSGDSFWTWREVMYRFLDRMTPSDVRAVAALAYMEMLEGGFTRVGEFHYLHHGFGGRPYADLAEMSHAIAAAAGESGIALTLLPVLYSYSGFGAQPPQPAQMRFVMDIDRYGRLVEAADAAIRDLPDAIVGVAPHSLRAVSPEQLGALADLGAGRPIHIHIAEQVKEVADCLAWSGQRPVEWLLNHAPVDGRWCVVHATHMTSDEIVALAKTGAIAGLCPITEANLGDGLFPAETFLTARGRFGVGSDSNVLIDASEELRLLEYGQRLLHRGRNMLAGGEGRSTGADLYTAAVDGGATALGAASGLAVGAPADIVSLDIGHPSLAGKSGDALLDAYIFAAGRSAIDGVWRCGEQFVSGGRHRKRQKIVADYVATLGRLTA
ncbi:formimidoylglutamate deiminase [Sphingopyxis panaciterrae]